MATTRPEVCGPQLPAWKKDLDQLQSRLDDLRRRLANDDPQAIVETEAALALQRRILLANPLLRDFSSVLLVRRSVKAPSLGLPQNWESNCILPRTGYGNDLAVLTLLSPEAPLRTLYRPSDDTFVGDVELHFDTSRLLFSKSDPAKPWQVFELKIDGSGLRQVTPDMGADVDNYDACYLPNGDVLFGSTATMVAVPCVNGSANVADIYRLSADGKHVRQLCFDQEHNWCPTVLNNGKVLYLRWEYADLPHSNSRRLFQMNPDGTAQTIYYGTSSYWPNGVFFARPIPGHPTEVAGIVTGHHGSPRMGELVIFDPQLGRSEAEGAVQRIPGWGQKVERVVKDAVADDSWPKFLHPYPLGRSSGEGSGKWFLVACKPTPDSLWGIYLVDVFDNLLLLREEPGYALLEPVPIQKRPVPPVIPDRVQPERKDSLVYLVDVYAGPGLRGIPRGEVKSLRVFTYVYGYRGMGGLYGTIGMNGPWDMRRVLGTVPVEEDGSAYFRIPANTPIAVQPLDKQGEALQVMRSWFTGMPGEVLSCVGCHESQNSSPPAHQTIAGLKGPAELTPWHGPTRGFSFAREVQPVLDAKCITCHNGTTVGPAGPLMSLRGDQPMPAWSSQLPGMQNRDWGGKFSIAYANLHRFVRHPGIESDMRVLSPMDVHAESTELVQTLLKGHHNVILAPAEWDAIVTWIDLNTPFHGDWAAIAGNGAVACENRRAELRRTYGNLDDYQIDPPPPRPASPAVTRKSFEASRPAQPRLERVSAILNPSRDLKTLDLGGSVHMTFAYIPPGECLMGSADGAEDEQPVSKAVIRQGFWMATVETSNEQYEQFDPTHDSGRELVQGYQFGMEGYPLSDPQQPVVRVSWHQAVAFCQWLSARTGQKAQLPTEAQWEYACRAGTVTPFSYGGLDTDFSRHANLADLKTREFACDTYLHDQIVPLANPTDSDDWLPKDARFNDGALVSASTGHYQANPWGLRDMHGNVAEWTRSEYRPYPYVEDDGRNKLSGEARRVVRGGSWRDRPLRATSSYRLSYRPYQPAFNVGFRVILQEDRTVALNRDNSMQPQMDTDEHR
ncbi:MAG: SUMF1/EgtB/PvdO family nonheme iron enzyme [Verrucomicrobia bacterium]|nr:SUMF1/EgtB/PvdO family nonheme iron enzyme [Verrucomicrobiota bacterium]